MSLSFVKRSTRAICEKSVEVFTIAGTGPPLQASSHFFYTMLARSMLGANHARDRSGGAGGSQRIRGGGGTQHETREGATAPGFAGPTTTGVQGQAPGCAEGQAAYRPSSPRQLAAIWKLGLRPVAPGEPRWHGVEAGTVPTSSTFLLLHLFYRWVSAKKKTLGLESSKRGVPEFMKIAPGRRGVAQELWRRRHRGRGAEAGTVPTPTIFS